MNSALAAYAYDQYAAVLRMRNDTGRAGAAAARRDALRGAVAAAYTGRWYKRVWLGAANGGWAGDERDGDMWTETQSWAVLADVAPSRVPGIVAEIDRSARAMSPVGATNTFAANRSGDYAGVWWCGNLALVAALGRYGYADLALDEWRKNLLATRADVYPDIWFGVLSGPDTFNSVLMDDPGSTRNMTIGFPVMNMWTHTMPLYSIPSVVGATFTDEGVELSPTFRNEAKAFAIRTPLFGVEGGGECCALSGWYAPVTEGRYTVTLRLTAATVACCADRGFAVRGKPVAAAALPGSALRFAARAGGSAGALRWRAR